MGVRKAAPNYIPIRGGWMSTMSFRAGRGRKRTTEHWIDLNIRHDTGVMRFMLVVQDGKELLVGGFRPDDFEELRRVGPAGRKVR